ncbi:hypothetical protein GCM10027515_13860 [Schumannella luteola]|uniref:Acetyl esterase/lipase n=1 Tax=Schumannella luteola TaxID=472059 RepID=A0A852Y7H2_9MICO|nr:prolyl oligopeptidase family serine peptidase [Schumannella luteola]NYG97832.1 acetyl esterase/lipase [Schumannella luteola]TPX02908.1 prolyl oligopeptidase family serine peptidase [Schumannella luteola]
MAATSTPSTHVIVLPGGGYAHHAPHEGQPVVDWLAGIGMPASVFLYPVSTRHPGVLDAVRAEIRRVRESKVERVGVLGFSAGGHAAGHAAYAPLDGPGAGSDPSPLGRPDFAILSYPVVSMVTKTHGGSRRELLGPDASDELRASTSLEKLVTPGAPPAFVWHTAEDAVVPVGHSYRLGRALAAAGVPHALHVYPHGPHGIGLGTGERFAGDAVHWTEACERWLREEGWMPGS